MVVDITYFVHGTTTDNENNRATGHAPGELSELGVQQAKELEGKVDEEFDTVFCSDLRRAVESAKLAFGDKYNIIRDERLRECDYGEMTQDKAVWDLRNHINETYPDGESYIDVEKRIKSFLDHLKENHSGEKIAIVAHQAPQLALEVLTKNKTWEQAIEEDWREVGEWQPGWKYSVDDTEDQIEEAKEKLEKGCTVVFPTETAYGIAADALNQKSVDKVYRAKHRPREKGLTVIVDSLETVETYAKLSEDEKKIVEEFMPGPLTLIAEKKDSVPDNLNEKFVFRISSGEIASKLAEFGPITATSANISGKETSYSVDDISEELLETVDYVIDAGELEQSPTSTIVELEDGEVVVHREGPVSKKEVEEILK